MTGRAVDEEQRSTASGRADTVLREAAETGPSEDVLGPVSPATIAHVQRTAGNAAATRLVQRQSVEEESGPYGAMPPTGDGRLAAPEDLIAGGGAASPAPEAGSGDGASAHRTLRGGSRGDDVIDLQSRLNSAGASPKLETDGIFGPMTRAAVVAYQSSNSLDPDGIVGPLTWGKLDGTGPGGGGAQPKPEPQPEAPDPLAGLVTIVGHDASAGAVAKARTQAVEIYGGLAPANRARLAAKPVTIDIIPHDKQLTDLPEYAHLKGTKTFDGRLWDSVRGIQTTLSGVTHVAVAEEDLVTVKGTGAQYGPGFLEAHEGGHGLQESGLTTDQVATLTKLFDDRVKATGPITKETPAGDATAKWLSPAWYSASNKQEYFANSVAAYHGHPYSNAKEDATMYQRTWLATNDVPMLTLLDEIYKRTGAAK